MGIFGIFPYKKALWPTITQEEEGKKKKLERESLENHKKNTKKLKGNSYKVWELNT